MSAVIIQELLAHERAALHMSGTDLIIPLKTAQPLEDGLKAIGIRAHYYSPNCPQNRFPVTFIEEMEEPFETTLQFRYAGQNESSEPIWWRLTKDKKPSVFPEEIGIAPANILPLYE